MKCAVEVAKYLAKEDNHDGDSLGLLDELLIYVDGARYTVAKDGSLALDKECDMKDYIKWNGGFLSMSFEGTLYDVYNDGICERIRDNLESIFAKYGKYSERGDAWNLSLYNA